MNKRVGRHRTKTGATLTLPGRRTRHSEFCVACFASRPPAGLRKEVIP